MIDKNSTLKSDGAYKFKKIYLKYSLKKKKSDKLFVVFSGMTSTEPGVNAMSYYGLRDQLAGNVLHIADSFGNHGCYLLSISGDTEIQEAVIALINKVMVEQNISKENLFLVGTSKGATSAIMFGLRLGFGNIICGDPQIKLGDEFFDIQALTWDSVAYVMTGRIDPDDRKQLNDLIEEFFSEYGESFEGNMVVLTCQRYFEMHGKPLIEYIEKYNVKGIDVKGLEIATHKEIIEPFYYALNKHYQVTFTFKVENNKVIINSGVVVDDVDFAVYAFSGDDIEKSDYRMDPVFTFDKKLSSVDYFNVYLREDRNNTSVFKVEFNSEEYQITLIRSYTTRDEPSYNDIFTFEISDNQVIINSGEEFDGLEVALYAFSDDGVEKLGYRKNPVFDISKDAEEINHFNVYLREDQSVTSFKIKHSRGRYRITFLRKVAA